MRPAVLGLFAQGRFERGAVIMPAKGWAMESLAEARKLIDDPNLENHRLGEKLMRFRLRQLGMPDQDMWYLLAGAAGFCQASSVGTASNCRLVANPSAGVGPHLWLLEAQETIGEGQELVMRKGSKFTAGEQKIPQGLKRGFGAKAGSPVHSVGGVAGRAPTLRLYVTHALGCPPPLACPPPWLRLRRRRWRTVTFGSEGVCPLVRSRGEPKEPPK